MPYEKITLLLMRLYDRTNDGSLKWEATDSENSYQASFPDNSIRISKRQNRDDPTDVDYLLSIYDDNGDLIDEFDDNELKGLIIGGLKPYYFMKKLFDTTRRSALGTEEALNKLLKALEKDDIPF